MISHGSGSQSLKRRFCFPDDMTGPWDGIPATRGYKDPAMAQYWVHIIRDDLDPLRTFVTNPALYGRLEQLTTSTVLDGGCGEGYVTRWLTEQGHIAVGLDSSEPLVEAAHAATVGKDTYVHGDVLDLSEDLGMFDVVLYNFVLLSVAEPEEAIQQAANRLNPGGRLIIQTLNPTCTALYSKDNGASESKKHELGFTVSGEQSPVACTRWHHPLHRLTHGLNDAGFIYQVSYPQPIPGTTKDFVVERMKDPWFLLIDAVKQ